MLNNLHLVPDTAVIVVYYIKISFLMEDFSTSCRYRLIPHSSQNLHAKILDIADGACPPFYKLNALLLFRYSDIIYMEVFHMIIDDFLRLRGMTKYRLAVQAGIPHATLNDICSGKTHLDKCTAETVYKLSKALNVPMELLTEDGIRQAEREQAYEHGLPEYLQHDLDAYKEGLRTHSSLLDCLWGELYGSINMAAISDGVITPEHADYLRKKFLFGGVSA